ncbi:energy transducer TonB [Duganella sp. Root198D2]|uniref:energy transducer TonB n=1 Tax=Duganella sp. Root198D2 TaxID=1736489 RepID=UPI00070CB16C|nr:energy transducer TonB [Duganella sp. Root198D2]
MKQLCTAALLATLTACAYAGSNDATTRPLVDFSSCGKPAWPKQDLEAGHTGTVTLSFTVDEHGAVKDSAIVKSSGHRALDEAARSGIAKCRFKNGPGKTDVQYVWIQEQHQ